MKNQVTNNVHSFMKSIFTPAALALALIASSIPSSVNATEKKAAAGTPVEVTYLGKVESQPLFQINIDNAKEDNLYATLKDDDGNILYAERFKDKKFSKRFRLNVLDANNAKVTFTLTSKNEKPQVLEIKKEVTTVEDVVITKVN